LKITIVIRVVPTTHPRNPEASPPQIYYNVFVSGEDSDSNLNSTQYNMWFPYQIMICCQLR